MQGIDGLDDLYFHCDLGPMDERAFQGTFLTSSSLVEFSKAYQLAHPRFTKGKVNVHYCAWPMPMLEKPLLNFRTPEGLCTVQVEGATV
jgi:hypothetical protein